MHEMINMIASRSLSADFFLIGLGLIYVTGAALLFSVALKFWEHAKNPQPLANRNDHPFSTKEMLICVLFLFPFWLNSYGQLEMDRTLQVVYFTLGSVMVLFGVVWHVWSKINIRLMWSDGIEIKKEHRLMTSGAYALARHPMYASLLMWCIGGCLVMFNWITLGFVLFVFLPLLIMRARDEEKELVKIQPDYVLFQQNVRMLTPTMTGWLGVIIKVSAIVLFAYYIWVGITLPSILLLSLLHLYLGYCLQPEKVAFSYRSKAGMMVLFWALSLLWAPFYYLLYLTLAMFIYGLWFNCPCMLVYNKYNRCPCFSLLEKLIRKKHCPTKH